MVTMEELKEEFENEAHRLCLSLKDWTIDGPLVYVRFGKNGGVERLFEIPAKSWVKSYRRFIKPEERPGA